MDLNQILNEGDEEKKRLQSGAPSSYAPTTSQPQSQPVSSQPQPQSQSAPPPAPEPQFQFTPQVAVPVTKTQTQTTEKSVVMPPAYGQAQQELDALQPAKQKNLEEGARIDQVAADLELEATQVKRNLEEQNAIKQAELAQKREEEFAKVDADLQAKADAISKYELKDYFANKSTFSKILLGIATGVGQYSATQVGGQNNAMVIIQNAIDNDFRQQKATLDKMKMEYDLSKGQRGITQEKYDRAVSDLNITHAQALTKAGDLIKEKLITSVKKPEIQQQLEANSIALIERGVNMKKAEEEKLKREVIKTTQKDSSVQVVGGPNIELATKAQDYMNKSKPIEKYTKARDSYKKFKELPDEVALVNFMVNDLDQGSIPPEMLKLLKNRGMIDEGFNWVREKFEGGVDKELKEQLKKSLLTTLNRTKNEAKRDIGVVDYLNKQAGMPPSGILQEEEKEEEKQTPNFGTTEYKKKGK